VASFPYREFPQSHLASITPRNCFLWSAFLTLFTQALNWRPWKTSVLGGMVGRRKRKIQMEVPPLPPGPPWISSQLMQMPRGGSLPKLEGLMFIELVTPVSLLLVLCFLVRDFFKLQSYERLRRAESGGVSGPRERLWVK